MVVSGGVDGSSGKAGAWLDELSVFGPNSVAEFYQPEAFLSFTLKVDELPLQPAHLSDLAGGDRATNAQIVINVLNGQERGPKRDAVLLNSAVALLVANRVDSIRDGWSVAAQAIDSGQVQKKLMALQQRT
jgi:anthranilate phosphoribosyltransferase